MEEEIALFHGFFAGNSVWTEMLRKINGFAKN